MIRRQVATELGIIVPPIRIRDNMQLAANDYLVKIKGQKVARGETYPEQFLAMDNGATSGPILGATQTTEPAFGLPAYWITEPQRSQAELLNYTVVEATSVLATHLTEVIKSHAYVISPVETWWNASVLQQMQQNQIGLITGQRSVDDVLKSMDAAWKLGPD